MLSTHQDGCIWAACGMHRHQQRPWQAFQPAAPPGALRCLMGCLCSPLKGLLPLYLRTARDCNQNTMLMNLGCVWCALAPAEALAGCVAGRISRCSDCVVCACPYSPLQGRLPQTSGPLQLRRTQACDLRNKTDAYELHVACIGTSRDPGRRCSQGLLWMLADLPLQPFGRDAASKMYPCPP